MLYNEALTNFGVMNQDNSSALLTITDLKVSFHQRDQQVKAVKGVSFDLFRGQCLGIVGESGSGKSVTSLSILNLLADNVGAVIEGSILYDTYHNGDYQDILRLKAKEIEALRGRKIAMVFQEPMSSLNPVIKCGQQVAEVFNIHRLGTQDSYRNRVMELFNLVSLPDVERVYESYPHELSGGQLQRVNIAMALAGEPDILICDEPTTALDVTVQRDIIELIKRIIVKRQMSLIFVSHDLNLVQAICDHVIVMYQGEIVENGPLPSTFINPHHKYTRALLTCRPSGANRTKILPTVNEILFDQYQQNERPHRIVKSNMPLFEIRGLTVKYTLKKKSIWSKAETFSAVQDVNFDILEGEVLGIVGESGSGKSTIAKCIAGMQLPTSGQIFYQNKCLDPKSYKDKNIRRGIQMIFQDPYSSLNPLMTIDNAIAEPIRYYGLRSNKAEIEQRTAELMSQVGLDSSFIGRYPHQLSGGQRQRVCIARALALEPSVLICDESVSALDVSVQAQILNLLDQIKERYALTIVFISHDLEVVHYLCDRVIVMEKGRIIEEATAHQIFHHPQMEYTKKLVAASQY